MDIRINLVHLLQYTTAQRTNLHCMLRISSKSCQSVMARELKMPLFFIRIEEKNVLQTAVKVRILYILFK